MSQKKNIKEVTAKIETTIVLCQCGSTSFNLKKKTKTAVELECSKCNDKTSVKGPVALTQVSKQEVALAIKESVVRPDPDYKPKAKASGGKPIEDEKAYTMLRFRIGIEAKESVVDRALEAVRVLNNDDEEYKKQTWQGHALEFICADFVAGCDPQALVIVDEIEEEMELLAAKSKEEGKEEKDIKRIIRDAKKKARDKAVDATIKAVKPKKRKKPEEKKEELKTENEVEPETERKIYDKGRLLESVQKTLKYYKEEYENERDEMLGVEVSFDYEEVAKRAEQKGGYVVKIIGDNRTKNSGEERPEVYAWITAEDKEIPLNFDIEYSDAMEKDLRDADVKVVEMIPEDYDKLDKEDTWEMPAFCEERERYES